MASAAPATSFRVLRDAVFQDAGFRNAMFETPHPVSASGVKSPHLQFFEGR